MQIKEWLDVQVTDDAGNAIGTERVEFVV